MRRFGLLIALLAIVLVMGGTYILSPPAAPPRTPAPAEPPETAMG